MEEDHYLLWIFHFALATTSATVVSGSLAERAQLKVYIMLSVLYTSLIYPVVVAWTWGGGWLCQLGFHDFAGAATIFVAGGCAGCCGSKILGERYGKDKERGRSKSMIPIERSHDYQKVVRYVYRDYHQAFKEWLLSQTDEFRPHNPTFVVTGTLMLWVAWLFFTASCNRDLFVPRTNGPAKIIMNTVVSGCIGGLVGVFVKPHVLGTYSAVSKFECRSLCSGIVAGLVAISGVGDRCEPWAACLIGILAALSYILGCKVLDLLHIDDPVEGAPIYLFGGVCGTLATGVFDHERGLIYGGGCIGV